MYCIWSLVKDKKLDKQEEGGGTAMNDETRIVAKDGVLAACLCIYYSIETRTHRLYATCLFVP